MGIHTLGTHIMGDLFVGTKKNTVCTRRCNPNSHILHMGIKKQRVHQRLEGFVKEAPGKAAIESVGLILEGGSDPSV